MTDEPKLSNRSRKRVREVKRKARPGTVCVKYYSNCRHAIAMTYCWTINRQRICAIQPILWHEFLSELSDKGAWVALNYVNRFSEFKEFDDNVERINVKDVSCQGFIDRFEKLYKPVVIEGMQVIWIHFFLFRKW